MKSEVDETAREVLQLPEDGHGVIGEPAVEHTHALTQLDLNMIEADHQANLITQSVHGNGVVVTNSMGQRISLDDDNIQQMEGSDENATYVLEPVTNEEYYQDDQNIMWIQETVEVEQESYENLPSMVIILNPNGTVNEELMLAHGMNQETIKALTDNVNLGGIQGVLDPSTVSAPAPVQAVEHSDAILSNTVSIKNLQHPIPKKDLHDVKPLFASTQAPRTVMDSVLADSKPIMTQGSMGSLRTIVESSVPVTEHCRSVILDAKDNYPVLEQGQDTQDLISVDGGQQATHRLININGTQTS